MFGILLIICGLSISVFSIIFAISKNKLLPENNEKPLKLLEKPKEQNIKFQITDEMIIRLAYHFNNKLCVQDLIIQMNMTTAQAKECLENLAQKGFCEIKLEEIEKTGKIYYYFD